jgi:hypothetical protein
VHLIERVVCMLIGPDRDDANSITNLVSEVHNQADGRMLINAQPPIDLFIGSIGTPTKVKLIMIAKVASRRTPCAQVWPPA